MNRRSPHAGTARLRRLISALALSLVAAAAANTLEAQKKTLSCGLELKLLVLSADGTEAVLPAITRTLDYLGTPYTLHIASRRPGAVTPEFLKSGCRGFYEGIVQTTASLAYTPDGGVTWMSALSPAESQALIDYETEFGVRHVNWYAFPSPDVGLFFTDAVDTSVQPLTVTFTPDARSIFSYLSAAVPPSPIGTLFWGPPQPFRIRNAYTYRASVIDERTIPLLVDEQGNVLAAIRRHADGREMLTMTFDGNANLVHSVALGYGVIRWVTRGLFIGERHTYMAPQVDDVLIHNDRWLASTPCGTRFSDTGSQIRMTGQDLLTASVWQRLRRFVPLTRDLRLTMAFNGMGSAGMYEGDTLTPAVKKYEEDFYWVSHTYTHPDLNAISYYDAYDEFKDNVRVAKRLKLTLFSESALVTPNLSGLRNPEAMYAAYDAKIRYVVSDASFAGYDSPFPNIGMSNEVEPAIYVIPRRPTNLYFNVAAPADWESEYNCIYQAFWGRSLSYAEILDKESDQLLMYIMRGEMNPWMFHQPNLVAYDGVHSLLSNLLDATLAKYQSMFNIPVLALSIDGIGEWMKERMAFRAAGATGVLAPDGTITIAAARSATVPVTGAETATAESYGGDLIARVNVRAGRSTTLRWR